MWDKVRKFLGTKKGKAAILAAFFTSFCAALPILEPILPVWCYSLLNFTGKLAMGFLGVISV